MLKTRKIASTGNYCRDSIFFAVFAWELIETIEPSDLLCFFFTIYYYFFHNTFFAFLDDGRIFAGIRFHPISIKCYVGIFWTLLRKIAMPTFLTSVEINLGERICLFSHIINLNYSASYISYILGCWKLYRIFFLPFFTPFLLLTFFYTIFTLLKLKKKYIYFFYSYMYICINICFPNCRWTNCIHANMEFNNFLKKLLNKVIRKLM